MAGPSNRDRITSALALFAEALEPIIARTLAADIPGGRDWTVIMEVKDGHPGKVYAADDPRLQLRIMTERLGTLGFPFEPIFGKAGRNFAGELRTVGDRLAHDLKPFSADDTLRSLDTTERLLRLFGAAKEADTVRKSRLDVQRATYAEETRRDTRASTNMPHLAASDLAPWREVLQPHADIAANDFARAEFAADLYQVATGAEDSADYNDPSEFFARTYLTDGLKTLLTLSVKRASGDMNAAPVINLQTTFGGGKTHSMLAVWHLFSRTPLAELPQGVQDLLSGLDTRVLGREVRRVAIVGNELAPGQSWTKNDGTVVRTVWGEMAWQLGGADAYALVAEADRTGTNPGQALRTLIERYAPAVILIDEWVAYARGLYGNDTLTGGTFETQFTFAQLLTEAVKAVPGALLLVSIPASDIRRDSDEATASDLEVGGAHGRAALERLQNVVSRVAQNWTPASSVESFEIVRRRLFQEPDAEARRKIDATAKRFLDYYRQNTGELPVETKDLAYEARIRAAYPIHPELFDRLYGDWSTLERFQRTRGVLRLMSAVVHALYASGDDSPLIMPGSMPLDSAAVRDEITSYLDDAWKSIIEKDIDGEQATSVYIDKEKPLFGGRALTRRIARATFMGSAATLATSHKGIERKRAFLGVAMPGDTIGNFGSALGLLGDRATYLYGDNDRYWFDRQPSLNRTVTERAESYSAEDVWSAVTSRLRATEPKSTPEFPEVIVAPADTVDVAESHSARLVLAHPRFTHDGKGKDSSARDYALELVSKRGTAPRVNANTIVVLAADTARWVELDQAVRQHSAWQEMRRDKDVLDLTQGQVTEASKRIDALNATVAQRIRETWVWTLYPESVNGQGNEPFRIKAAKAEGALDSVARHSGERLRKEDLVYIQSSPQVITFALDKHLRNRWNDGRISVGDLVDFHARYPYLPRLRNSAVLLAAIDAVMTDPGWETTGFALAGGYDTESGDFDELRIPVEDSSPARIDGSTLLVSPRLARAQRERETPPPPPPGPGPTPDPGPEPAPNPPPGPSPLPEPIPNARFSGAVDLKPGGDLSLQLHEIVSELLAHLQGDDPDILEIRLTVDADKRSGFTESVVRNVRENGPNLGFTKTRFTDL